MVALHSSIRISDTPHSFQASPAAGLRLTGVEKSFGANRVLRGIDLEIEPGSFVAIIGKSGCGKSTLLRILMGLEEQSSGHIDFVDRSGRAIEPNARIVFQEPRLLPWRTVLENVVVGLGANSGSEGSDLQALQALKAVQLSEKAGDWPSRLSGGQRQRVALARALVSHPGFLTLDEPLGALDALTRISMQQLLGRVWREQGFTAVLVTHDVAEAVYLADRVIVLEDGRIKKDVKVPFPHPRAHGSRDLAEIESELLAAILGHN
jgi:sulfonate transport system ATP-binding protein